MSHQIENKSKKTKRGRWLLKELFGTGEDANSPEYLFKYMLENKRAVESYAHEVGSKIEKRKKRKKSRSKKK